MPFDWTLTDPAPLSPLTLVINLLIGTCMSLALSWHFVKFAQTMGNKPAFARMLPFIALTTILVISVVKSSLALSLGLVGALSIVRFRTPIKEPEELAYIFLAIAIGLGLGADQRLPVVIAAIIILGVMALRSALSRRRRKPNLYLNVEIPGRQNGSERLESLTALVASNAKMVDVRRIDLQADTMQATFYLDCADEQQLMGLMHGLQKQMPEASISFVDPNNLLGA